MPREADKAQNYLQVRGLATKPGKLADNVKFIKHCCHYRAPEGEGPAADAAKKLRQGQMKALQKARAAEKSLRNRIQVVIKALQHGWEFAAAYEKVQNGATEDPLEEKARKLVEEEKRKKDAVE